MRTRVDRQAGALTFILPDKSSLTPLNSKKKHIETPRSSGRRTEAHAYSRSTGKENRRPAISDPDAFWQLGRSVRDGDEESDEEEAGNESDADSDWNEEETLVAFLHDSCVPRP